MPTPRSRAVAPVWLFDLDNTLHDAGGAAFAQITESMTVYMERELALTRAEAEHLRGRYWQRYGATLLGLMRHHDIDPDHFLHHTHQFPDIDRLVVAERGLKIMLKRLPGRKILFSNAPRHYVDMLLAVLGIHREFSAIYAIEALRYRPKPAVSGFLHLLREERLDPRQCVMVEDTLANLKTARALRMKTVWVSASTRHSPCVDVKIRSILDLPKHLGRL